MLHRSNTILKCPESTNNTDDPMNRAISSMVSITSDVEQHESSPVIKFI